MVVVEKTSLAPGLQTIKSECLNLIGSYNITSVRLSFPYTNDWTIPHEVLFWPNSIFKVYSFIKVYSPLDFGQVTNCFGLLY